MTTDPALDARALALLDAALDHPPDTRAAWLRQRAGADTALADRALKMLGAGSGTPARLRTGNAARDAADAPLPEHIGAYRITGLIGRAAWARSIAASVQLAISSTSWRSS